MKGRSPVSVGIFIFSRNKLIMLKVHSRLRKNITQRNAEQKNRNIDMVLLIASQKIHNKVTQSALVAEQKEILSEKKVIIRYLYSGQ